MIRFLEAEHFAAADIHRSIVDVYGEEVMSCESVGKWLSDFKSD